MQKQRARRQSHHAQHPVQRLRQHALNFSAHKTRRRQVQVRQRQHIALDPALLFFVRRHHHQHRHERRRHRCQRASIPISSAPAFAPFSTRKIVSRSAAHAKNEIAEQPVRQRFLTPALDPENRAHRYRYNKIDGSTTGTIVNHPTHSPPPTRPGQPPRCRAADFHSFALRIELRAEHKAQRRQRIQPSIERRLKRTA